MSREHNTAAVGFQAPQEKLLLCVNVTGPGWASPEKRSRPAHGWKGRPRNWQRSARWYQVHKCSVSRIEFGSIDPNGLLIMSDSIHETAATPSVSLAAVVTRTLLCMCVFSKTMYVDRHRYTVFCPYTVCRPNTKSKISRTHTRTYIFGGMYQLETRFARIIHPRRFARNASYERTSSCFWRMPTQPP